MKHAKSVRPFPWRRFLTLIFLGTILVLFIMSVVEIYQKKRETELVKNDYLKEKTILLEKKEGLEASINDLNTPAGQEAELRTRFGVSKENESAVFLFQQEVSVSEEEYMSGDGVENASWWRRVFGRESEL
jgi:hypothetical protein